MPKAGLEPALSRHQSSVTSNTYTIETPLKIVTGLSLEVGLPKKRGVPCRDFFPLKRKGGESSSCLCLGVERAGGRDAIVARLLLAAGAVDMARQDTCWSLRQAKTREAGMKPVPGAPLPARQGPPARPRRRSAATLSGSELLSLESEQI